ncbi:MAG: Hsp20/alpha crystallin family protein [Patescibacteria group bacterium]
MRLIPWSPMMNLDEFENFTPALDIYQTKDAVVVETPVVKMDPNKVNISIENDVLTIEGESEQKSEVDEKNYYRKEVRYGGFHRSVALPVAVDGEKAEAEYKEGLLKITIPKAPQAKKKTIKIKAK